MKNYYLKRIDEIKTEIGTDMKPEPVATATRVAAGVGVPLLRAGAKAVKQAIPKGGRLKTLAKRELKRRADIEADKDRAATEKAEKERDEQEAEKAKGPDPDQPSSMEKAYSRRLQSRLRRREREARRRQEQEAKERARKERLARVKQASIDKQIDADDRGDLEAVNKERRRRDRLKDKYGEAIVYTQIGYILAESMRLIK